VKLFLPQTTFEAWSADEKADLSDGKLVVFETRASHAVLPAVHFLKLVSGSDDNTLIGKVKTMAQLDALGAEHMADSVILGETAYEVAPGYITEVDKPAEPKKGDKGQLKKVSSPEADLLAAFILDKL
jgi:hypothetical protein